MILWRRLSALVVVAAVGSCFGLSSVGCGAGEATPCDEALNKAQQCGVDNAMLTPTGEDCAAVSQCEAKCVLSADCGTIKDAVNGVPNSLLDCIDHCG